jgi:hypothetical protein
MPETGSATDTEQFITTYGHENAHNYSSNESLAENTGSYANTMWGLSNMFSFTGTNDGGVATSNSWVNSQMNNPFSANILVNNTISAGQVTNSSPLTVYVEGTDLTGKRTKDNSKEHGLEMAREIAETLGDKEENAKYIYWAGENTKEGREKLAEKIDKFVSNYEFSDGEDFNIGGHSHGGNGIKEFSQIYDGEKKIDNFNIFGDTA